MEEKITKSTWKNFPIDKPKRVEIELFLSDAQYLKLIQGFRPRDMDDKWFVYYEADWVYFHRSWTGFGVFKAKLNKVQDGYFIQELWVESNHEKFTIQNDEAAVELFKFLVAKRSETDVTIDHKEIFTK